jgi:hypothetical protein
MWNCLKKAIEKLGWLAKLTINDISLMFGDLSVA